MSSVIIPSPSGYMSSKEICDLTQNIPDVKPKQTKHCHRDIERMLDKLELESVEKVGPNMDPTDSIEVFHTLRNNGQVDNYYLNRRLVEILITGWSVQLRARIIDRLHDIEARMAVAYTRDTAAALLGTELKVADLLGCDQSMAKVIAVKEVRKETGFDFGGYLIGNTVEEGPVNPTTLADRFDLGSARQVNKILADLGLQVKENGEWTATDIGRKYSTRRPYSREMKEGHVHSGFQLLWFCSALAQDYATKGLTV